MRRRTLVAVVAAVVALTAAVAAAFQIVSFRSGIRVEVEDLLGSAHRPPDRVVTEGDLARLPEPVARWLRHAGVVGKPIPTTVRLRQEGTFRLSPDGRWMPFTAEEYFSLDPPGFVWVASMDAAPFAPIVGRDRYVACEGSIEMRLFGLVPVAQQRGGALNQGALLRYLNETMWFPAAALDPRISWTAVDENRATATMSVEGVEGSATFVFDDEGRLVDMFAERYYAAGDAFETWSTPLGEEREFAGVRVPANGEGVWKLEGGDFSYIRLRIVDLEYDPPGPY